MVIASRLRDLERKRSLTEASLLNTERAFQRAYERGGLTCGIRGIGMRRWELRQPLEEVDRQFWGSELGVRGPGFGAMSPDIMSSRRVRVVRREWDL